MSKKALSLVLASMIACSAAGAVSASWDGTTTTNEGETSGTVQIPKVDVTLPTFSAGSVYFDIYNQTGLNRQVISPEFTFTNNSTVPVQISLKEITVDTDQATPLVPKATYSAADFDGSDDGARNIALFISQAKKDLATGKFIGNDLLVAGKKSWTAIADAKLFPVAAYGDTGTPGTPTPVADLTFDQMGRGKSIEYNEEDGTMGTATAIPPAELGSTNTLTFRFDGALNATPAAWVTDEAITLTPVFEAVAVIRDLEQEAPAGVAPTVTAGTISTSAIIKTGTTSSAKYTVSLTDLPAGSKLKTTLDAADYVLTYSAGKTLETTSMTATATGTTITFSKFRVSDAAKGDTLTLVLNPSAFVDATGIAPSAPVDSTLAS